MTENIARQLTASLTTQLQNSGRALLVIDGDCAAGKTTLAAQIAAHTDAALFHMDDFFLPPALRTAARLAEAGGNIDYDRFLSQVLQPLRQGIPFAYEAFSCHTGTARSVSVSPAAVTVIEGSYALHPRFLDVYNALNAMKVFLAVDPLEQLRRIERRNGAAMLKRFQAEWIPMEKKYQLAYAPLWGDVLRVENPQLAPAAEEPSLGGCL